MLILIFIAQYWVDKYNLFRKFSCPLDFNFFLTRLIWKAFECSLFIFAVGTFIFDMDIRTNDEAKYKMINLVNIGISGLYLFVATFGPLKWQRMIFAEEDDIYTKGYSFFLQKKKFRRTYWNENPATTFIKQKNINNPKGYVESPDDEKFVR